HAQGEPPELRRRRPAGGSRAALRASPARPERPGWGVRRAHGGGSDERRARNRLGRDVALHSTDNFSRSPPTGRRLKVGREVHLFYGQMRIENLQRDIEQRLATAEPDVEVLACEDAGKERLRLFIDHPNGVDLALCERVTKQLRDLLAEYSLEVSSPGPERPLS